jgi:FMN phosphatase YigB (HAD superfamily)
MQVGWKAVWVRRNAGQLFDPWGVEPTIVVPDLASLVRALD